MVTWVQWRKLFMLHPITVHRQRTISGIKADPKVKITAAALWEKACKTNDYKPGKGLLRNVAEEEDSPCIYTLMTSCIAYLLYSNNFRYPLLSCILTRVVLDKFFSENQIFKNMIFYIFKYSSFISRGYCLIAQRKLLIDTWRSLTNFRPLDFKLWFSIWVLWRWWQ